MDTSFKQHRGKKGAAHKQSVYFKITTFMWILHQAEFQLYARHFWCCSHLLYQINLVILNNVLGILLIFKQIKFTKQRRKRIIRVGFGKSGAVIHRCFWIWLFSKILQISQENVCWSLFLIKLLAFNFIKTDSNTETESCEICEVFKNTCFYRTPPVTASGKCI